MVIRRVRLGPWGRRVERAGRRVGEGGMWDCIVVLRLLVDRVLVVVGLGDGG